MTISTVPTDARIKELCGLMRERFSMNPVSCKILNEEWKASFPSEPDIAKTMLSLLARTTKAEAELLAVREAQTVVEVKPYGYLRENNGQVQISIGPIRPADRASGYATPWGAIYAAPPAPASQKCECSSIDYCDNCLRRMSVPAVTEIKLQKAMLWLDAFIQSHPGMKEPVTCRAALAAAPTPTKAGE